MSESTWETWKLAHAYPKIGSGTTPTSSEECYYSGDTGVPWVTTAELRESYIDDTQTCVTEDALRDFSALRSYSAGSLMMAMYGATIGRLGMTNVEATCNQACCVFERSDQFNNRFLFYWLWHRRADLIALSAGGGQPNLSRQDLREEQALCPPLDTQRDIADYLDERTARIDGLIARKERLLELLAEKRQALITRAVTKGLDPSAGKRDCGADEGIGLVSNDCMGHDSLPDGWTNDWLKWSVDFYSVRATENEAAELPYISNENIASWTGKLLMEPKPKGATDTHHFKTGDVLFNKLRPYLAKAYLAKFDGVSSGELLCLRPSDCVSSRYLFYYILSSRLIEKVNAATFGVKMPRADWNIVGHQTFSMPARAQQEKIADYLDERTARIDDVIAKNERLLKLLAEKRRGLITAAVIGQLEIEAT